ncbi:uncharacterized protein LOC130648503 [Hydractinia symbiolongicarpus]|uniref:uncharacterized protein LOC130648503 n=1 Tax=Hydractinia symbiolongicarpus TaxID=13093 RepID=UPI00254DBAA1|nr:uncharacterized protein LOC130648503 [Hydractinia symbiolongicarpus]
MIYRYTRVIFGMNASQFLLAASIIKHLKKYQSADPDFVLAFLENLYVDDSIGGGDTSDQVFTFYQKAKARFKDAGLILRKWRSNSPTLQAQISKFEIEDPAPPDEKILGIKWDTANDEMEIDLSRQKQLAQSDVLLTKRNILKIIASIYDPVGLVSPLVVPFKVFFQKLCTTVNDWDTEFSKELKDEWNSLIQLFSISSKYRLQRYYFANYPLSDLKDITLHGFCDASKRSYSAVVYIIGTLSSGRSVGRIVCSKTKVSPLNELSIPRLELLSCLLLSSLIACISQSLGSAVPVALKFCWSDSIDALCWVRNNNSSKKFVKNRVTKFRDLTPPAMWRFCPGKLNPADLPSRGVNKANKNNWFQTWTVGPSFIYEDQLQWPEEPNNNKIKITSVNPGTVDPGQSVKDQRPNSVPNKFSTLHSVLSHQNLDNVKNVCSTEPVLSDECPVICKRTVDLEDHLQDQRPSLRQRTVDVGVRPQGQQPYFSGSMINSRTLPIEELINSTSIKFIDCLKSRINGNVSKQTLLSTEDLEHAELLWVKTCQKDLTSRLNQLNNTLGLFIDKDDIIRCKRQLLHANLPYDSKYPILLPGDSYLSTLIIQRVHQQTFHAGVKHTLCRIREKYWILQCQKYVRAIVNKCVYCKRLFGKAYKSTESANLPPFRVSASYPFQSTGVDYLGPLMVKPIFNEDQSAMFPVHVALFTCAVTRAVHLDVVPDQSASPFIRTLKRFTARRGIPTLMISDNATCFKNEELRLSEELSKLNVKWKYIVEAAPWWGGFWERLTYNDDIEEVLTPSHLMHGRNICRPCVQSGDADELDSKAKLSKRMMYIKTLKEHFWNQFSNEYITNLRELYAQGPSHSRSVELGEIVIIHSDKKRINWRMGKVTYLITSRDNNVRAGIVKLFTPYTKVINYMKRPIEKLYPLEVKSVESVSYEEKQESIKIIDSDMTVIADDNATERPTRIAADNSILIRPREGFNNYDSINTQISYILPPPYPLYCIVTNLTPFVT